MVYIGMRVTLRFRCWKGGFLFPEAETNEVKAVLEPTDNSRSMRSECDFGVIHQNPRRSLIAVQYEFNMLTGSIL